MIPKLPDDVIFEILSRLPVKPLLKFRCVCKSWLSLISSQQFVKTHLINSKKDPNFTHHMVMLRCFGNNFKQCSLPSLFSHEPITVDVLDTEFPVHLSRNMVSVVGSCNGLICLSVDKKDLILWNPNTRIHKNLPDFGVELRGGSFFVYGFGFDKSSDDYKVVGFLNSTELIVKVYSLKSDRWKMIEDFTCFWLVDSPAAFAHEKLHWTVYHRSDQEFERDSLYLDLETEEYGLLQVPNYVKGCPYLRLVACEERLFVVCEYQTSTDVWIMGDYDDGLMGERSWTKVVSIPLNSDDIFKYIHTAVLYVLKNGEVLLFCGSAFVIFDAEDCSFRYPEIRYRGMFGSAIVYVESLVSPIG